MTPEQAIKMKNTILNTCIKTNRNLKSYADYCKFSEKDEPLAMEIQACAMPLVMPQVVLSAHMYINAAKQCCQIGKPMITQLAIDCKKNKCETVSKIN